MEKAPGEQVHVRTTIDGEPRDDVVEARTLLVHLLRDVAGRPGALVGCDTSNCGACTVLLDGESVKSCTVLAAQVDGCALTTVHGLEAPTGELHPVQEAFRECHGLQCGFCTPGMVMATVDLLRRTPTPTEPDIRSALNGNICRCTGYQNIVRSVQRAAELMAARTA
ncbi:MAG TPA: (2Fe-2S)-binding protein [Actinomycetales bacterium]|jgi:carbon-monoxide dehydrogenase small subunit|nr:(2Fe-2S)-binding protein [Actinomycetales bacterium]